MSNTTSVMAQKRNDLSSMLEMAKDSIAAVVPKHLTPERMMKMAMVAASRVPRLYECTAPSVLQSVMCASELGLDCSGTLGQGFLIPFKNSRKGVYECQFIIGYKGMIELAKRSGEVQSIQSHVVYEKDHFKYKLGLEPIIEHTPTMSKDRGKVVAVYAVAKLKSGEVHPEVMLREDIDDIRSRSKSADDGPWVTDFREMARKTVVRRIFKYLPASVELTTALEHDNNTAGINVTVATDDDRPRAEQLLDRLENEPETQPQPEPEIVILPADRANKLLLQYSAKHNVSKDEARVKLLDFAQFKYGAGAGHLPLEELEELTPDQFKELREAVEAGPLEQSL